MFKGTGTAILTPFNENNSVDYDSFEKLIEYQIKNEVNALVVLGTTGEAPVINDNERNDIVDFCVQKVNNRVKVIVGTGTNDPEHVILHNSNAEKYGADGLLIVNPYYNKGTQKSILETYKYICHKTTLPVILYNVPSRTGINVLPETIVDIANLCDNVVAVKEASGDISQVAKLIAIKPNNLDVISGNDDQTLPIMSLGGVGVISAWANVFPKEMVSLVNAALKNDFNMARNIQNIFLTNMQNIFLESSPIPIKYLASQIGLCKNILRLPLTQITKKTKELLDKDLQQFISSSKRLSS